VCRYADRNHRPVMKEINTSGQYGKKPDAPATSPETLRIAELRASICSSCEFAEKVTPPKQIASRFMVSSVNCKKCGCSGANLLRESSPCPIGRHPE
jgi:hypothetical protein